MSVDAAVSVGDSYLSEHAKTLMLSCEVQILTRIIIFTGVIWFRQVVKGTEITGSLPPYGAKTRTDEDNTYGELKAA